MTLATRLLTLLALLLLVGSAYFWHRARVVTMQPDIDIKVPVQLTAGSVLEIPLSIPSRRACEAAIQYPTAASIDIVKVLHALSGEAALMVNETIFARSKMPTHTIAGEDGFMGTILFTFKSKEEGRYILVLRVDQE